MQKLTPLSKALIAVIVLVSGLGAAKTYGSKLSALGSSRSRADASRPALAAPAEAPSAVTSAAARLESIDRRPVRIGLSEWPGHMPFVIAAGGLTTRPGSVAAKIGLNLEVVFIEDAAGKNEALQSGKVDFVWQTVDELPISLGSYLAAGVEARALLQIDWSRGGDACVASREVQKVEDILGRTSAMMMFSPDHTVFEFMITNSRLTPAQIADVRKKTQFSPDDFTYGRKLFSEGKADVACLWEPDVTLALAARPGAHRLFSTADATDLVADVVLARKDLLDARPDVAQKLARVWLGGVEAAERDRPAAARVISTASPRFRDELGYQATLEALGWVKWTALADNVRFFGLDGTTPAFDRVYNQADSIWIDYPEAEIKNRFAPSVLRDDRAIRAIWEASGKPTDSVSAAYDPNVARAGTALFTKPLAITFATASSELDASGIAVINQQIVPELEIARSMYVRIEGNTDSLGEKDANQRLSERRAQAIVEYLVSRGFPANRMVARGNGAANPVASNKTPDGRAQNRRTDVLFIRGTKS